MPGEGRRPSPPQGAGARPRDPLAPHPAPVTPRASLSPDGEPLPLHDQVQRLLRRNPASAVTLVGPRGSGKTAALEHLAATLPPDSPVVLVDADGRYWAGGNHLGHDRLIITAARDTSCDTARDRPRVMLEMARWDTDHLIEYLLATRRDCCASVMNRLKNAPGSEPASAIDGVPGLWSVVLDAMCENSALATPAEALRHVLASRLGDAYLRRLATDFCLQRVLHAERADGADPPGFFERADALLARLIGYRAVQVILAAQRIVWDLAAGAGREHVAVPAVKFPPGLVREVAALAAFRAPVMHALRAFACGHDRMAHPTAATILHATKTNWRPEPGIKPCLTGAKLTGAEWPGADLSGGSVSDADLSGATLTAAKLDDAAAGGAVLRGASLRGASLRGTRAIRADLRGADLVAAQGDGVYFDGADLSSADLSSGSFSGAWFIRADLRGARLVSAELFKARLDEAKLAGATLAGADLRGASLSGVDLTETDLAGADLSRASLLNCDLQNIELCGGRFRKADLCGCDLTGSALPGADFRKAVLRNTGLADVSWEGADLRGADFTGASFHLGSSRSGLVGSTIPCEGSRTGFYTDDFGEQYYRPPEEVRKADLRGADLRGARVKGTDFYLVDLRGARYTEDQAKHFRRCGAIL